MALTLDVQRRSDNDDMLDNLMPHWASRPLPMVVLDNDTLEGGRFNDTFEGGTGTDTMTGLGGDDTYVFAGLGLGIDSITGEAANADTDTLDFSQFGQGVNVNLDHGLQPNAPNSPGSTFVAHNV